MSEQRDSADYEYYIIDDGLGISHVLIRPKRVHPSLKCGDSGSPECTKLQGRCVLRRNP